jgi:hypothetical protein
VDSKYAEPAPATTSDTAKIKNARANNNIPKLFFLFLYQDTNLNANIARRIAVRKLLTYATNVRDKVEYLDITRI